jgi:hypothetical protein
MLLLRLKDMTLDIENLMDEFNIEHDAEQFKVDVEDAIGNIDIDDPDKIVTENLGKANAILDRVILEMNNGGFSARLAEVSSQIMSVISSMTGQVYKKKLDIENLQMKRLMLELRMKSLKIKDKSVNQNIIITDRETILRFLKDEKQKQIENMKGELFYDGQYNDSE